jgi:hypothetical protein
MRARRMRSKSPGGTVGLFSNGLFTMAKGGCVFPKDHTTARVADFYINYGAFTTKYLAGVFAEFVSV